MYESATDGRASYGSARFMILPDGPEVSGTLARMGERSCAVASEREMNAQVNNQVELRLEVEGFQLRLLGVVRQLDGNVAGIEFVDLSSRKAEQIEEVMRELATLEQHRKDAARRTDA